MELPGRAYSLPEVGAAAADTAAAAEAVDMAAAVAVA